MEIESRWTPTKIVTEDIPGREIAQRKDMKMFIIIAMYFCTQFGDKFQKLISSAFALLEPYQHFFVFTHVIIFLCPEEEWTSCPEKLTQATLSA